MPKFTVCAVYLDNYQRYAETVEAADAIEAENLARDQAGDLELAVACVIEGEPVLADVPFVVTNNGDALETPEWRPTK